MTFLQKYKIEKKYLTTDTERRPGTKISKVGFIVAHDTGNPGSTADGNIRYYENSRNDMNASAHTFIDDKSIIECIPLLTGRPEKAWHVIYDVVTDNKRFGDDANDIAGGVELCWGKGINFEEAYKRYVWYLAYACHFFGLNPSTKVIGHELLDPKRKIDPSNGLKFGNKTYQQLLNDIVKEYNECTKSKTITKPVKPKTVSKTNNSKYILPNDIFKKGDKGSKILTIQKDLCLLYFYPNKDAKDNGCTGIYDSNTVDAVKRFQLIHLNKDEADGIYGPKTKKAMEEQLNK